MRPGRVLVQAETCQGSKATTQGTTRLTGRSRTAQGLTEVRMEVDGTGVADLFIADDGRLVDLRSENAEMVAVGRRLLDSPMQGEIYKPLRRNEPHRVTVPITEMFATVRELEDLTASEMELTVEYLGHTAFEGRRAAGYRLSGQVESLRGRVKNVPMEISLDLRGLMYADVANGVTLVQDLAILVSVRVKSETAAERVHCQTRFDAAASRGF
jgi:hypothetical protein